MQKLCLKNHAGKENKSCMKLSQQCLPFTWLKKHNNYKIDYVTQWTVYNENTEET